MNVASAQSGAELTHPKYRADIDGLRAIAVLSVMAFHAFPLRVQGGFIGVDIFFVISGFLISTIIFKSLSCGEFSFLEFYSRRVRRIFPALATVLVATLVGGWFVLYPDEYRQLGKHVFGGAGFISNFVLLRESGYFDAAADTKPLLHLWSLGIEEQFYIVFPLFVWLLWRMRLNVLTFVVVAGLVSFLLNLRGVHHDVVRTFYMPHTRVWELLIGSVLAWMMLDASGRMAQVEATAGRWCRKLLYHPQAEVTAESALADVKAWLGVLLVVVGLWKITKGVHFPGGWALLPTLGAALLIWAGPQAYVNRRWLSARVLVWIGKISYPLYLWHWVLLTYLRIEASGTPPAWVRAGALGLAVLLSWLTYRLIEKPLRFGSGGRRKTIALAIAMIAVACLGLACYRTSGFSSLRSHMGMSDINQFDWPYMSNAECMATLKPEIPPDFCMQLGNPEKLSLAILGDSTANALVTGIGELAARHGQGIINVGSGTCPPVRGLIPSNMAGPRPNCNKPVEDAYRLVLADKKITTVVMGIFAHDLSNWPFHDLPANASVEVRFERFKALLDADIRALQAAGKKVIVTYDAAYSPISSRDCLNRPFSGWLKRPGKCEVTVDQLIDFYPYQPMFENHFRDRKDVCIFRQSELLLTAGRLNLLDSEGKAILRDSHHLSTHGSRQMALLLEKSTCGSLLPWQ